jgi:DNA uptake protein ComE-like DNA-binding protein
MIVAFALAAIVVVLCERMRVERMAAANQSATAQASEIERGAEQYCLGVLSQYKDQLSDMPDSEFAAVHLGNGYFWVLYPNYDDDTLPVFGMVGEASKLNINTASYDQLMRLPGMTDDVAGSIVDWRDEDSTPTNGGVESDYYLSLPEPYTAKNGPFETLSELLMVKGIDPTMLYGDGTAPPLGQPVSSVVSGSMNGSLSTDPQLARGWYDLLTCYSIEGNTTSDGQARININSTDSRSRDQLNQRLQQRLGSSRASAIMSALGTGRNSQVRDIFDFYFKVNLTPDEFDKIADDLTTNSSKTVQGRIDINTAPRDVLLCLDGLDETDVDKLIAARQSNGGSSATGGGSSAPSGVGSSSTGSGDSSAPSASIGWVAQALGQKAIGLGDEITTHSSQFSADILAVSGNGRGFKRVRVVIDTRGDSPQIIFRRDITTRGWPMDPQILASLRAGTGPGDWPMGSFSADAGPSGTALGGTF